MDTARDRRTGNLVEALLLKDFVDDVDQNGYECPGCSATAIPCSFKPENLRIPHFRVDGSHAEDCDVGGETVPVKSARQKTASTNKQTTPGRYPNRLMLKDTRPIVSNIKNALTKTLSAKAIYLPEEELAIMRKERRWAAGSIRPICRIFLDFPYGRKNMKLEIPGFDVDRYAYAFKRLENTSTRYDKRRIFYAPISWKQLCIQEDSVEIPLGSGLWKDGKLVFGYRVKVDCSAWKSRTKSLLASEINETREDAIHYHNKELQDGKNKDNNKKKGWLFFIGQQDRSNPFLFHVNDRRLICCFFDEVKYS